jgi:glycerate kinase
MRVLVAPDKFKGSLTAREVAARVAAGIGAEAPGVEVEQVPVADGGDGTLDAAVAAGYTPVEVRAQGPTGEPVTTAFAARDDVAVVEMADVSGLALLMPDRLDALGASSYGTGEVVRAALDHGCREIVLGIGGSASTDGGAGMLQALGARLLSSDGQELGRGGAALADLARLDLSGLHPALAETRVVGGERRRQPAARPQWCCRGVRAAEGRLAIGRGGARRRAGPLGRRRRGGGDGWRRARGRRRRGRGR